MPKTKLWRGGTLITVASITGDPVEAFENAGDRPAWITELEFVAADPEGGKPTEAIITIGRKHLLRVTVNLFALAALWEMTRPPGISVVTNSNHGKRPRIYPRLACTGLRGRLLDIRPIFYGAPKGRATKPLWHEHPHDYSPDNTRTEPDPHTYRASREVALEAVTEAARTTAPDLPAYLANLAGLFAALDAIREAAET